MSEQDSGYGEFLQEEIRKRRKEGVTQKSVAEALELDPGNFSKMLRGDEGRILPRDIAEKAAALLGITLPEEPDNEFSRKRRGFPVIPAGALPMDLPGDQLADAFATWDDRLPNWTGHEGAFGVRLDEDAFHYRFGWVIFVAPHKRPAPGEFVYVRFRGRQFVAKYQAFMSGFQVADERQAYPEFEVLGVIVGHLALY